MTTHTFDLTDTRTATPVTLQSWSYDDATKTLTIDCSSSASIPATPTNGEAVLLGVLNDLEIAAKNKIYSPNYPISEPLPFNNPDLTSETNYQFYSRTNAEESPTVTETQIIKVFSFVGWFKGTAPTAANAVNDND